MYNLNLGFQHYKESDKIGLESTALGPPFLQKCICGHLSVIHNLRQPAILNLSEFNNKHKILASSL